MAEKNFTALLTVAIGFILVNIGVYYYVYLRELDWEPWFVWWTNIVMVVWALIATVSFYMTLKLYGGMRSDPGQVWFFLFLGGLFWVFGDGYWLYAQAIMGLESPFPSAGDYFYSIAYVFFIIGIILQLRIAQSKIRGSDWVIFVIVFGAIVGVATYYILIPIFQLELDESVTMLVKFYYLFYPIGDLVMAGLTFLLVFRYRGGEFSKSWMILVVGFFVAAGYDLAYNFFDWQGTEGAWIILDHFYNLFYILFAIGSMHLRNALTIALK